MAKVVILSKPHAGLSHELGKRWVTIGRAPGNDFQIQESSVSGQHCEVLLRGMELLVRDMRSTNGTFLKGRMITEGTLKLGEVLRLGDVELRLEVSDPKTISLSVYGPAQDQPAKAASPASETSAVKRRQILLVDDSMAFLETAGELFELFSNAEWEIHRACGADQALNLLQEKPIEIAVLDLNMPMLDGVQLLGMLHRRHPEVKKVILTAQANEAQRTHCLASGAELFLEKPITRDGMRFVFNVLNDLITWKQREGFAGTLRQVGLADIIQIECLRRSSCVLEIQAAQVQGEIYIDSGAIVHAVSGGISGEKALQRLLSLNNGQFHLYPYRQPAERTVTSSYECLLMEAAQLRDEERGARAADKTVFITRSSTMEPNPAAEQMPAPPKPAPPRQETPSPPSATPEELDLGELGNGIVVVSTYDGEWKPTTSDT
jgi:CheY-like chemotaxis protein